MGGAGGRGSERRWFEAGRGRRPRSEEVEGREASEPGARGEQARRAAAREAQPTHPTFSPFPAGRLPSPAAPLTFQQHLPPEHLGSRGTFPRSHLPAQAATHHGTTARAPNPTSLTGSSEPRPCPRRRGVREADLVPTGPRWAAALDGGTGQFPGTHRPEGQSQLGGGGALSAGCGVPGREPSRSAARDPGLPQGRGSRRQAS